MTTSAAARSYTTSWDVTQHRSTQRKVAVLVVDEVALTGAIVALALQYGRYG